MRISVNLAPSEIGQPSIRPTALTRVDTDSVLLSSGNNLPGFSCVLDGLLGSSDAAMLGSVANESSQRTTATVTPRQEKRDSPPKAPEEKNQAERSSLKTANKEPWGGPSANGLHTNAYPAAAGAPVETTPGLQTGGVRTYSPVAENVPTPHPVIVPVAGAEVAVSTFATAGAPAGSLRPSGLPLSSARDIAFGLSLIWQPAGIAKQSMSTHSNSNSASVPGLEIGHDNVPTQEIASRDRSEHAGMSTSPAGSACKTDGDRSADTEAPEPLDQGAVKATERVSTSTPPSPQSTSIPGTASAFLARGAEESRSAGAETMNRAANAAVDSRLQSSAAAKVENSSAAIDPWTMHLPAETGSELDADGFAAPGGIDIQCSGSAAPIQAKVDAGAAISGVGSLFRSETQPQPDPAPFSSVDPHEEGESGVITRVWGATHATSDRSAQNSTVNDPQDSTNHLPANPGSDASASKSPGSANAPQTENSHEQKIHLSSGVLVDGALDANVATAAHTKTSTQHLATAPAVPSETEVSKGAPTQPVREMALRLNGDATHVDVQVSERAGKIQVAVRTPDQDLATSLQSNLGELVGHLEAKGYRTDAWTPVAAQHGSMTVSGPSSSANSQSQSQDSGSQGGQPDSGRQGQQGSNQRNQGRWKAQFEESVAKPTE